MPKLYQHIPAGYALTITSGAVCSGSYVQITPGSINTPETFSDSSTTVVGAFNDPRDYQIDYQGNVPSLSCASTGVFTAADEASLFVASIQPNVAAVTDSGELLAVPNTIAAVNAILDVLIANNLMEAPEE